MGKRPAKGLPVRTNLKRLQSKFIAALSKRDGAAKTDLLNLITEFSESGEPKAIVYLLSCLSSADNEVADAAAAAVASLIKHMDSRHFARLDDGVRGSEYYTQKFRADWDEHRQELVPLMRRFEPQSIFIGLASMHRNGHVRELALGALDTITDGSETPYLLLRVSDWVPAVSNKAKQALSKRLHAENAGLFLEHIVLIDGLRQRQRGDGANLFHSIQALAGRACLSDFLKALESPYQRHRRLCFYIGLAREVPDRVEIVKHGLKNSDHIVRQMALASANANFSKEEFLSILKKALKDRFPLNRKEALRLMLCHYPELAEPELKTALLDRSSSVRGLARFHLKEKEKQFDFAQFYRDHLRDSDNQTIVASLAGLAESGQIADYAIIELFLKHQNDQIKKAAIHSLLTLDKERSVGHLYKFILHESDSLSSEARKGLLKCCRYLQGEELWRLYSSTQDSKTRYHILRIIAALPKWESLGYCLLACKSKDECIKNFALAYLQRWQEKYGRAWRFTSPTKTQTERIKLAAPLVAQIIAGSKFRELHSVIDSL